MENDVKFPSNPLPNRLADVDSGLTPQTFRVNMSIDTTRTQNSLAFLRIDKLLQATPKLKSISITHDILRLYAQ